MLSDMLEDLAPVITAHLESVEGEGCGFVLKNGEYIPLENRISSMQHTSKLAEEKGVVIEELSFLISAADYLKYSRQLAAIVHSHHIKPLEVDCPSISDMRHQKATAVPWAIYSLIEGVVSDSYVFESKPRENKHSPYRPGLFDMFTCVEQRHFEDRVYFRDENLDINHLYKWLVLSNHFTALKDLSESWRDGDVGFFGEDHTNGFSCMALYDGGAFHYRLKNGELNCKKTPPASCCYQRLRKT